MGASVPRQHHTNLPAGHLGYFAASDGFLTVYDKLNKKSRRQRPENVGTERDYNSTTTKEGAVDHVSMERFLSQFEVDITDLFKKLANREVLSELDRTRLAWYVGVTEGRNKVVRLKTAEFASRIGKKQLEAQMRNRDQFLEALSEVAGRDLAEDFVDIELGLDGIEIQAEINQNNHIINTLTICGEVVPLAEFSDWVFFHAPDRSEYVIGDRPIVVIHDRQPTNFYERNMTGWQAPHVGRVFPLTKNILMYIRFGGRSCIHRDATSDFVGQMNHSTFRHARSNVYGSSLSFLSDYL